MKKINLLTLLILSLFIGLEGSDIEDVKQKTLSYVSAYNKKDAKAMADHWAQNAPYSNPITGRNVQGRTEIEKQLTELLPTLAKSSLKVEITSVDFPTENTAIERGKATLTKEGEETQETAFQITFAKENGQWKIQKIDEVEWIDVSSNFDHLKDLEWLIGNWVDASDTVEIASSYSWDTSKNFITHHFTVTLLGKHDLEGKQIIGWDAAKEQVRSWMFDSDGGFAEGTWKKQGQSWVAQIASTLPDGRVGSQTTIITPIDKNSYTLEITGREIDGEILPDLEPTKIVRK